MDGIDAAFAAGFDKVKVNTVLMRDVNHHQLDTFPRTGSNPVVSSCALLS